MLAACPFPTHQGTQVFIRHLAESLSRAGHQVHLITYGFGEYETPSTFKIHRAKRFGDKFRSGPSIWKPAADLALLATALRVIAKYKCEIIHAHNVEGLAVGGILAQLSKRPLVYHAHNAMAPELPTYFQRPSVQAIAAEVGDALDRYLPRLADGIIAFDYDQRSLLEINGVSSERVHVIPPGLDLNEIRGAEPGLAQSYRVRFGEGPVLLYAGNPDHYQNIPLMLEAFRLVKEQLPQARLVIATSYAATEFAEQLKNESKDIDVVTYDNLDELRAIFAAADIGLCPRQIWVGAPIKILNYMAAGLPVVACRSAGRHLVGHAAGMLSAAEPHAFAQAILQLLQKSSLRITRRNAQRFAIDDQIPQYEHVYRQILMRSPLLPEGLGAASKFQTPASLERAASPSLLS